MTENVAIGIDPGEKGKIVLIEDRKIILVQDLPYNQKPYEKNKSLNSCKLYEILFTLAPVSVVVVEKQFGQKKHSILSIMSKLTNYGRLLGVVENLWEPDNILTPYPISWQAKLKFARLEGTSKQKSMMLAKELFGSQLKDDHTSDAALLAYYGYITMKEHETLK